MTASGVEGNAERRLRLLVGALSHRQAGQASAQGCLKPIALQ